MVYAAGSPYNDEKEDAFSEPSPHPPFYIQHDGYRQRQHATDARSLLRAATCQRRAGVQHRFASYRLPSTLQQPKPSAAQPAPTFPSSTSRSGAVTHSRIEQESSIFEPPTLKPQTPR
ncbi:hypothetical protein CF326_g9596 [Tilletia indica]|uniref:Uncharacterized protein n=1 Tax=Tilletia indica TaxID=43049 RepID=A0A177T341_9BASI|nr:hypothetical protein CF326_g9596 [Tilletia indica]KAE8235994.1 hypothetical protein A4X13_0g9305 [Tilletia indica]